MTKRLRHDAFSFYVSLGPERSYAQVATKYGVSKRAVTHKAGKEKWQQRAAEMEERARKAADEKLQESLEEMHGPPSSPLPRRAVTGTERHQPTSHPGAAG